MEGFFVPINNGAFVFSALTKHSGNLKTGNIAVSRTSRESCPATCPFQGNGCYGDDYYTGMDWDQVTTGKRGKPPEDFIKDIKNLEPFRWFRHDVVGDLWHENGEIIESLFKKFVEAMRHLPRKWTYTHHQLTPHNQELLRWGIDKGFTVNLSTESKTEAAKLFQLGWPVCCVTEEGLPNSYVHNDVRFVRCPHSADNGITQCSTCGNGDPLCNRADRKFVITFPAHGTRKKQAIEACSD